KNEICKLNSKNGIKYTKKYKNRKYGKNIVISSPL
ncbi:hypothetical protein QEI_2161, partial [Clostridioides difficile CD129]